MAGGGGGWGGGGGGEQSIRSKNSNTTYYCFGINFDRLDGWQPGMPNSECGQEVTHDTSNEPFCIETHQTNSF